VVQRGRASGGRGNFLTCSIGQNLAGHRFLAACSAAEKAEILRKLKDILMSLDLGDEFFTSALTRCPRWKNGSWSSGIS